jgi:protein gp37
MPENTKIQWAHHSWSPWRGCTKVSEGCANCYAAAGSKRNPKTLGIWGPDGTRVVAAEDSWEQVRRWDRKAKEAGERHRVFPSLCDPFENWDGRMHHSNGDALAVYRPTNGVLNVRPYADDAGPNCRWATMSDVRASFFRLIDETPNLDWLLLTKRPENIARMMPPCEGTVNADFNYHPRCMKNVWLGTSCENQEQARKRLSELLKVPAAVHWVSAEPLLEDVDFSSWLLSDYDRYCIDNRFGVPANASRAKINWLVVGGESGHGARACAVDWIYSIIGQCKAVGVPIFVKQIGSKPVAIFDGPSGPHLRPCRRLMDSKGGDWDEWSEDLRIREFPKLETA